MQQIKKKCHTTTNPVSGLTTIEEKYRIEHDKASTVGNLKNV
jgi:hypothetical protein